MELLNKPMSLTEESVRFGNKNCNNNYGCSKPGQTGSGCIS